MSKFSNYHVFFFQSSLKNSVGQFVHTLAIERRYKMKAGNLRIGRFQLVHIDFIFVNLIDVRAYYEYGTRRRVTLYRIEPKFNSRMFNA